MKKAVDLLLILCVVFLFVPLCSAEEEKDITKFPVVTDSIKIVHPFFRDWNWGAEATDIYIRTLLDSIFVLTQKAGTGGGEEKWCTYYQGGFFSSYNTIKNGEMPSGTWAVRGARQVFGNIWLRGSYERVDGEGVEAVNYPAELILHTRDPTGDRFQLYGILGGALAHPIAETDSAAVVYGWSVGLGGLIPMGAIDATIEAQAKAVENDIVGVLWFGFRLLGP